MKHDFYTEPHSTLFEEHNPVQIIGKTDDDIVIMLSDDQERELAFMNIIIIDDHFYLNTYKSREFSKAFIKLSRWSCYRPGELKVLCFIKNLISIMKDPQVTITINAHLSQLPEILTKLVSEPVLATLEAKKANEEPTPHKISKPEQPKKKALVSSKPRKCIICGGEFLPNNNAQKKCTACKHNKVDKHAELDKTLNEIEEKRKKPYKITN